MTEEYTYFEVTGRTRALVERVAESQHIMDATREALCERFGALEMIYDIAPDDSVTVRAFVFDNMSGGLPADWVSTNEKGIGNRFVYGLPSPETPDSTVMEVGRKALEKYAPTGTLEKALETGEMPQKSYPAGRYDGSFVKRSFLAATGWTEAHIRDHVTPVFASNASIQMVVPLDYMELAGRMFLRVPNDDDGKAVYMPPESVSRTLGEMYLLDRQATVAPQQP